MIGQGETYTPADAETLAPGVYTYWAQCGDVCAANRTPVTLTVNPTPTQPGISTVPICEGETAQLCISYTIGDFPGADSLTYTYIPPSGSGSQGSVLSGQCVDVTEEGEWTGYYTVYYPDGTACSSPISDPVLIDGTEVFEPTIQASGAGCEGGAVTLSVPDYNGVATGYLWTTPNGTTTNISGLNTNEIIIDPTDASIHEGGYSVTVTVDGCQATSDTYNLDLNPAAVATNVTGGGSYCAGTDIMLSADDIAAGMEYTWTGPNGFTYSGAGAGTPFAFLPNVDESAEGVYTLTLDSGNGCSSEPVSVNVTIEPAPATPQLVANATELCLGDVLELSVDNPVTNGQVTYEWYNNAGALGTPFATTSTPNVVVTNAAALSDAGAYTVIIVNDSNGTLTCSSLPSNFVTIAVEDIPEAATNTVDLAICEGEAIPAGSGLFAQCPEDVTAGTPTVSTENLISDMDVPIGFSDSQAYGDGTMPYADPGVPAGSTITNVNLDIILTTFGNSCESDITIQVTDPTGAVFGPFTPFTTCNGTAGNNYTANISFVANSTSTGGTGDWIVDFLDSNDQNPGADEFWARFGTLTYDLETPTTVGTFGTVTWWDTEIGGNMIGQGETYTPADSETLGAGVYTYWAQCGDVCAAERVPVTLTVNPKPATPAISQNGPVCEGDSVQLCISFSLADYPNATSIDYTYISPSGSTSVMSTTNTTDQCIYVTEAGEWTGFYTVFNADGTACSSDISAPVEVVINEIPETVATNGGDICPGELGYLYGAPSIDGATYTWTVFGESTIISTDQNPVITNLWETTTYELTVSTEGCIATDTTVIVVTEPPVVDPVANYTLNNDCSLADLSLEADADSDYSPLTYDWTGPNGFTSNAENPVIPNATSDANGQYTVTVTDAHGCSTIGTTNVIVDINDPVAQPVVSSTGPTCEGGIVVLTVPQYNGSVVDYAWSYIDSGTTVPAGSLPDVTGENSNQLVISPVDADTHEGGYSVTVTIDACELTSDVYNLDVFEQPTAAPMASTPDNCEGSTLSLFANAANIDTLTAVYFWTGPNGFTSNAENPEIANMTVANNGTYTVIVTSTNGCSVTESVNVTNIMLTPTMPTIATNSPICEIVDNIVLTVPQQYPAGATYTWLDGTGAVIATDINGDATDAQASIEIAYNAVQPFSVIVTVGDCDSEVSQTVSVNVDELPIASATNNGPICTGEDVQLFAGPVPGATYEWTVAGDPTVISTAQNPVVFNVLGTTTYELTVVSANGCISNPVATTTVIVNTPELATNTVDYEICEGEVIPAGEGLYAECVVAEGVITSDTVTLVFDDDIFVDGNDYASNGTLVLNDPGTAANIAITDVTLEMYFRLEGASCESDIDFRVTDPTGNVTEYIGQVAPTCMGTSGTNVGINGDYLVTIQIPAAGLAGNNTGDWTVEFKDSNDQNTSTEYTLRYGILRYIANDGMNILGTVTWWDASTGGNILAIDAPYAPAGTENLVPGTYTFWAECGDPADCPSEGRVPVNLIVNPAPATPVIAANTPICNGADLELSTSATCDTYYWIGPGGSSEQTLSNPLLTTTTGSTVIPVTDDAYEGGTWYVICEDASGCTAESATVDVTIDMLAAPIVTNTTAMEQVCEGETVQFFTETPDPAYSGAIVTFEWFVNGQPWIMNGNPVTAQNPTIDPASPADNGEYVVIATIDGCQSVPSTPTMVTVTPAPDTPVATATSPVCEGEPIQLNTPFIPGATYEWVGPAGFTSNLSNPFIPVSTTSNAGEYFVYITIDGCASELSAPVVVVVNSIPANPTAINTSPACVGEEVELIVTTTTPGAVYTWYDAATNLPVGMGETLTLSNVTLADQGDYYVVADLSGCMSESGAAVSTTTVVVNDIPGNQADAGEDIEVCGGTTAELDAVVPSVGTGSWSSPTGGTITNPDQASTDVLDLQEGVNVFVWTISNGACNGTDTDTVMVVVEEIAVDVAFAGVNQELCASEGTILSATAPTTSGVVGTWSQSTQQANLGIIIDNPNDPATTISGIPAGTVPSQTLTFTWTLSNGVCGEFSTDEVIVVNYFQPDDDAFAGLDFFACDQDIATLAGENPTVGLGIWTQSDAQESAGVEIITDSSGTSIVTGLQAGPNVFTWSLYNGVCGDVDGYSQDEVVITVQSEPITEDDLYELERSENPDVMTYEVTENDDLSGLYGSGFSIEMVEQPENVANIGTLVNNGDGTFDYLPEVGFYGSFDFVYEICSDACESLCSRATVTFTVNAPRDCMIPNVFTPNMDGMNDSFEIPCLDSGEYPNNTLMVFNRWGDKVYETKAYQNDWYGTYSGQDLPEGTYYYILDLDNGSEPIQGFVMIQR